MKCTILTGGTGSVSLQEGLWEMYGKSLEICTLVNHYDNGKSTGAVRKVYGGKIGGPSDIRKNQLLRAYLEDSDIELCRFLQHRFTSATPREFVLSQLLGSSINHRKAEIIRGAINHYFSQSLASQILYEDFAIGNIVYAGLAGQNGNSIQCAADIMKELLEISADCVISDDNSLFLSAKTQSGKKILDEGQIVAWNNPHDRIIGVGFTDNKGNEASPMLSQRARNQLLNSDIIILSAGTQWSSLIPTYECLGFKEVISKTSAKIFMVMNGKPDFDCLGMDANEIWNIVSPYLPTDKVCVIQNDVRENIMSNPIKHKDVWRGLICDQTGKHMPISLVTAIMGSFFKKHIDCETFGFDWDNTIKGRRNSYTYWSKKNIEMLESLEEDKFVCSGNTIDAISLQNVPVFAENGLNYYYNGQKECLNDDLLIQNIDCLINFFTTLGINYEKISNRNWAILSIKPLSVLERRLIKNIFDQSEWHFNYRCYITGTSTIDIMKKDLNKGIILTYNPIKDKKICYLGDEPNGNDKVFFQNEEIETFEVKSPKDTYIFLRTLKMIRGET